MNRGAVLFVASAAWLVASPSARGDEAETYIQTALTSNRRSLVVVEAQGHVVLERIPGLGEAGRRLIRVEAPGVVVGKDGLVAFAAARLDPAGRAFALVGGRARPEVERVTIHGADGSTHEGEFVGRDETSGLAFARLPEAARRQFAPAPFRNDPPPKLGAQLALISLGPAATGRAPRVDVVRVASELAKPRRLLATTPPSPGALGALVIALTGSPQPVGVLVALPEGPAGDASPSDETRRAARDLLSPEQLASTLAGYVLPAEDVVRLAEKPPVEARGVALRRARAWLGFKAEVLTPELAKAHGLAVDVGVRVAKIYPGGPAEKAGLKVGDVLTRLDGEEIDLDPGVSFETLVVDLGVGTKVKLTVFRAGKAAEVGAELAESPTTPDDASRERLGVLGASARELTFFDRDDLGLAANAPGVVILELDPDGPGARAGLRPGDVIEAVESTPAKGLASLREAIGEQGERTLAVRRGKETLSLKLRR